jgi:hypothetical protein
MCVNQSFSTVLMRDRGARRARMSGSELEKEKTA